MLGEALRYAKDKGGKRLAGGGMVLRWGPMNSHTWERSVVFRVLVDHQRDFYSGMFTPDPVQWARDMAARDFVGQTPKNFPFKPPVGLTLLGRTMGVSYLMVWRELSGCTLTTEEAEEVADLFPL